MKGKAGVERSSLISGCRIARAAGPAMASPTYSIAQGRTVTPAGGAWRSNQRRYQVSAAQVPIRKKCSSARRHIVKSPISLPRSFSMGVSAMRPMAGTLLVITRESQSAAPLPVISNFP